MADRSGYIGRAPGDSSVIVARKVYEPTGVQTDFTFTAGYTPGYCDAYVNGVKLINSTDYTASDGSTVGLTSAAQSGDVVEIVAYKAFNLGMPISDVTGNLDVTGNISASSSITGTTLFGDGTGITNIAGVAITQYIAANSLTVTGSPGVSTITRLGVTDAVVTGIITANGLSGNVTGAAATFTTGTFNGNVTIGGTLTYEDVTNVDALGIVTARAGVNVSGGQLLVGSGVTIGNAGVATFSGTSDVHLLDNVKLLIGDSSDLQIHHNGTDSNILGSYGDLYIQNTGSDADDINIRAQDDINLQVDNGEAGINIIGGGQVELYHHNDKKLETTSGGIKVTGNDGVTVVGAQDNSADLFFHADGGDDNADKWYAGAYADGTFHVLNYASGSWEESIKANGNGNVELYYDNVKTFETIGAGISIYGPEGGAGQICLSSDEGDDNADKWRITKEAGNNSFRIQNYTSGSWETSILATGDGTTELYYDASKKFETTTNGAKVTGEIQTGGTAGAKLSHAGTTAIYESQTAGDSLIFKTTPSGGSSTQALAINSVGDVELSGTAAGVASCTWDASANSLIFKDDSEAVFGDGSDLSIYHQSSYPRNVIETDGRDLVILTSPATGTNEKGLAISPNGSVELYYDNSNKIMTTNEGVNVSGMMSASAGLAVTGGMWEGAFYKVGKLSDNQTIGISTSNIFVFATTETTTSTPNIIWNDTYPLSSKMKVGDVVTVTVISVAAAGGYSANWTIDGNAISEQWNGGSAPSAGGSDGFDIYTHTIVRKGTGTGDSGWLMFSNVSNFT